MTTMAFYDQLAPFYHLIYADWNARIGRQAGALDTIIKECWPDSIKTVLDVACGIGTQALGLAELGYAVTGSDLSSAAIEVAQREAAARGLTVDLSVADMRVAYLHHQKQFDLVIACDNSVSHLLTDAELLQAFQRFYACTRPGGGGLISVRDYEQEDRTGIQVKPHGLRTEGQARYVPFQVWEFHPGGRMYDVTMYRIEDRGGTTCDTHVMRTQYYAVGIGRLMSLMMQAGFQEVQRLDDRLFQPVILGTRPEGYGRMRCWPARPGADAR